MPLNAQCQVKNCQVSAEDIFEHTNGTIHALCAEHMRQHNRGYTNWDYDDDEHPHYLCKVCFHLIYLDADTDRWMHYSYQSGEPAHRIEPR